MKRPFEAFAPVDASTVPTPPSGGAAGPGPVGIVLAGGASRRFGSDKARLEIAALERGDRQGQGTETLAAWAFRRLAEVCAEVAVADAGRGVVPGERSLPDGPGRGPAAGLLGAARAFPARRLLALACDLPAVPAALLARIAAIGEGEGVDLVLPRWDGGAEPLAALYAPRALAELERRVAAGNYALHDLGEGLDGNVVWLSEPELSTFGQPREIFANLNTPEDLKRWSARVERG